MLTNTRTCYSDILEKVVAPTALIMIDDDVIKIYINPDVEMNAETAKENIDAIWDIVKDRKVFHMIVPDSTTHITMGINEFGDEQFEKIKKAEALVIKTLGHRILAKAFMNARKGKYPVRVFDSENDATAWFNELREQAEEIND